MINAIIIDGKDDVVVAIYPIEKNHAVIYSSKDGELYSVLCTDNIPIYHKIAVRSIDKGTPVIKYGEPIGIATKDIKTGMHVHEHNVSSKHYIT